MGIKLQLSDADENKVEVFCPGCKCRHHFGINVPQENGAMWIWNGDVTLPTFKPSLVYTWVPEGRPVKKCHSFLRNGIWEFLSDCTHSLVGQKVPMIDLPDWMINDE